MNRRFMKKQIDMSREARRARYNEFIQLRQLPFFSKEQAKRLRFLTKQRVIDNREAFKRDCEFDRSRDALGFGFHEDRK